MTSHFGCRLHFCTYVFMDLPIRSLKLRTKNEKYSHPSARDRTWPDVDSEVRIRKNLYERVTKLHKSEYLRETLPFFDFDRLKKDTEYWVNKGNSGGGLFLTSILTIDNMLRDIN